MGENDIRIPKQKRSIEKKQRIKDAAMKLMSEKGYHSTSSNEIAKEAGVSIGTFYSYYKDKKELYKELVADIYNVVLSPINPDSNTVSASGNDTVNASDCHPVTDNSLNLENLSIEETVYLYISTVFKGHEYQSEFQREIASLSEQSDEFREIEMSHKKHVTEMFSSILNTYRDELKVTDINTAVYMILTTVEAVIHDTVFHNKGKNKKAVIKEMTAMVVNYLFRQE
ncbi:MAG: TetR/AcrR family transcriptional regulator [Eubacterium sp.]|nr:TetR/AcrR family transcriptional regulator [Eubacterium sp.]